MLAIVRAMIPVGKVKWREAGGITSGTAVPSNSMGNDGDIYFKIL
jgi:hypothetical protein